MPPQREAWSLQKPVSEGLKANVGVLSFELLEFIGVDDWFSTWIKNRIKQYGFTQHVDFIRFDKIIKTSGGRSKEYYVSIDMAKELAMVERNEKGREGAQNRHPEHKTAIAEAPQASLCHPVA